MRVLRGGAHGFGIGNPGKYVDVAAKLYPVVHFGSRGRASRLSQHDRQVAVALIRRRVPLQTSAPRTPARSMDGRDHKMGESL